MEDCLQFASVDAGVHHLVAVIVEPGFGQQLAEMGNRRLLLTETGSHNTQCDTFPLLEDERGGVVGGRVQSSCLARHRLDHHADRHSRRESMRIEENIRDHPGFRERHRFHWPEK